MARSFFSSLCACTVTSLLAFSQGVLAATNAPAASVGGAQVSNTILVFARDAVSAQNGAVSGLQGYGIPYEIVTVPQAGISAIPTLNYSSTYGNYGGIVMLEEVGYDYNGSYYSALTTSQWQQMFDYQTQFGVRMVRLDVFPTSEFGTYAQTGTASDQPFYFTNMTGFTTAGLKSGPSANASTLNIYHTPANITDPTIAWEFATFNGIGTAGVVNQIGTRQQMVWFIPSALDWSPTSNFMMHAWVNWVTRGLYMGFRRMYFSTQIDDMFLITDLYEPAGQQYRVVPADMDAHVTWQADINSRMPAGSDYFVEIGHNGNGDIEAATDTTQGYTLCNPNSAIEYDPQPDEDPHNLEYMKPLGSGTNIWPATPTSYQWNLACCEADALENWFADETNRDTFAHISHTFTHEDLTNATYSDTWKEIHWNRQWLDMVGLADAKYFSPNGIIPPAITGLHNGDALRAWLDNGIVNVVGDNTRPVLQNVQNKFWPLTTTVSGNGYAGINVIPRWATTIYYNCDLPNCTLHEWINTSGGSGTMVDLLANARSTNTRNLLGLHQDPYMFHQANLRAADVATTTVEGVTGQFSLLMTWVETIFAEMTRLTTWPFVTLKHDDIGAAFIKRQTKDQCRPSMVSNLSPDGTTIQSVTVYTGLGNKCNTTVPLTTPSTFSSTTGATLEQRGTDPLTLWITMAGSARTYNFTTPLAL